MFATPYAVVRLIAILGHDDVAYARLPSPMGTALTLASFIRRTRLIVSVHGVARRRRVDERRTTALRQRLALPLNLLVARASAIFVTDRGLSELYGVSSSEARVIPFRNSLLESVPDLGLKRSPRTEALRIAFVGRLTPEKNPGFVLEVAKHLASAGCEVHVDLVGDGELRSAVLSRCEELRRSDIGSRFSLVHHGWVDDHAKVMSILKGCHFLLLPSLTEGAPKILSEAMAVGVVAVTRPLNESIRDLTDDGRAALLMDALDEEEWSSTILRTVGAAGHYENVRLKGVDRAARETAPEVRALIAQALHRLGI